MNCEHKFETIYRHGPDQTTVVWCRGCGAARVGNPESLSLFNPEPAATPPPPRLVRKELPSRRHHRMQKLRVGNQVIHLGYGDYNDGPAGPAGMGAVGGSLGEIWIDASRSGTALRSLLQVAAIFMSIGLQHGVDLAPYVEALLGWHFEPNGAVECSPDVTEAESVLDAIGQQLRADWLEHRAARPAAASAVPVLECPAGYFVSTSKGA